MDKYLAATDYFDYNSPEIQDIIEKLELENLDDVDKVRKIFYYVRDSITYSAKLDSLEPFVFKASHTIQQDYSFCIPKAVLLGALTRAFGIPSRIHLVDFINHRLSDKLADLWGTNVMAPHSYTEIFLNDEWIKLTPALDIDTCTTHRFVPVEFDGESDGLLGAQDLDGNPHVEYVNDYGSYEDVPHKKIIEIIDDVYGPLSKDRTEKLFGTQIEAF